MLKFYINLEMVCWQINRKTLHELTSSFLKGKSFDVLLVYGRMRTDIQSVNQISLSQKTMYISE
jgi:hypothetical protein